MHMCLAGGDGGREVEAEGWGRGVVTGGAGKGQQALWLLSALCNPSPTLWGAPAPPYSALHDTTLLSSAAPFLPCPPHHT